MMKLLDRYIFNELIIPFISGIAAFTIILAGSTVLFSLIGEAIKYSIPFWHVVQLFLYRLPAIIALSFPMAVLLATLIAFGRMGNDLEILAFRAGGLSVLRLVIPVILFGFCVSIMTIWFNESVVPRAASSAEDIFRTYRHSDKPTIRQNVNLTEYKNDLPSRIINVSKIEEGILKSITVAEYDDGSLTRLIRANTGKWLPSGGWEFYNGIMHNFHIQDPRRVTVIDFKKEFINIKVNPFDLTKRKKTSEELTREDLKKQIQLKEALGKDPIKDVMDYHMKLSVAFASLIYSILGASIGLRPHRSSSGMGLGISLLIIFCYILLMSIGMGLGLSHMIPPLFAAWFPNIICGSAGLYLLTRVINQ